MKKIFILVMLVLMPFAAYAEQVVPVRVLSVYDGDTITVDAKIWVNQIIRTKVRIAGIDTPEIRAKCGTEKTMALAAKQLLMDLLSDNGVTIRNIRNGKYAGRVLADVYVDGHDVSEMLISSGYARKYEGGKRKGWC